MSEYYKKQSLGKVYTVSTKPTGFWRRWIEWLPYNVGQKVQLEVTVESSRERGLTWMDLTYFDFIEIMPDEKTQLIAVNESRIVLDKKNKHRATIYPLYGYPAQMQTNTSEGKIPAQIRTITSEGKIEYRLSNRVTNEEAMLFSDNVVFLHSSRDVTRYIIGIFSAIVGSVLTILAQTVIRWLSR